MIGIYKFTNKISGKVYIGRSTNISKRKSAHFKNPSPNSKFDIILQKEGSDNFDFEIIELCSGEELNEKEKYWIKYYDATNPQKGYNISLGGTEQVGENNTWSKLSNTEVLEIIELLKNNKYNNQQIANKYNVSPNTIDLINNCHIWTHLHSYTNNIRETEIKKINPKLNNKSGEFNSRAKIHEEQALEIISLLQNTTLSFSKIAQLTNSTKYIVNDINRCRTWKYLHSYKQNIRKRE